MDYEQITVLMPDLILAGFPAGAEFGLETLEAIAPTVSIPPTEPSDWPAGVAKVADAVAAIEIVDEQRTGYEQRTKQIRDTYADVLAATTFGFANSFAPDAWVREYATSYSTNVIATGARTPGEAADGMFLDTLSFEQLGVLDDVDVILVEGETDGTPTSRTRTLFAQPLWNQLPAVQTGRMFPLAWADAGDYPTAMLTLDAFEAILQRL